MLKTEYYELLYIIPLKFAGDLLPAIVEDVAKQINDAGGEIKRNENLGRLKLAYAIEHNYQGVYILVQFALKNNKINQLERYLKLKNEILRYLLIRKDEFVENQVINLAGIETESASFNKEQPNVRQVSAAEPRTIIESVVPEVEVKETTEIEIAEKQAVEAVATAPVEKEEPFKEKEEDNKDKDGQDKDKDKKDDDKNGKSKGTKSKAGKKSLTLEELDEKLDKLLTDQLI